MSDSELSVLRRRFAVLQADYETLVLENKELRRQRIEAYEAVADASKRTRYRGAIDPALLHSARVSSRFGAAGRSVNR